MTKAPHDKTTNRENSSAGYANRGDINIKDSDFDLIPSTMGGWWWSRERRRIVADVNLQFHGGTYDGNTTTTGPNSRRLISKLQFRSIWRAAAETATSESVTGVWSPTAMLDPINAGNCVIRASSSTTAPPFCLSVSLSTGYTFVFDPLLLLKRV